MCKGFVCCVLGLEVLGSVFKQVDIGHNEGKIDMDPQRDILKEK